MLCSFTVGNFCSFDKNQTLSLAASSIKNNKERLYQTENGKILKFASIFGANAAGKSNFIKGLLYAHHAVIRDLDQEFFEKRKHNYFRLNPENKEKTSFFEFEICIDGTIYAYGLEILVFYKKIIAEYLVKRNKIKDELIFSRNTNTGSIYFNNSYLNSETEARMSVYQEDFQHVTEKTFLGDIISNKNELYKNNEKLNILKEIYNWIDNLNISFPATMITGYDCFTEENFNELLKALRNFNTGITNVIRNTISKEQALDEVRLETRKKIEEAIQRNTPPESNDEDYKQYGLRITINGRLIFITYKDREPIFTEISFEHFNIKGLNFSLAEESDGTQRLLDLLSILLAEKDNSVFIIDEIERSLHPLLTTNFIKQFLHHATEKNIQLIITTHESHLLDLKTLRQDEIFFVESNPTGDSIIYPFNNFNERYDKKIEKAYLDGDYGAVPNFN